jgi:hypothetical protein
MRLAMQLGRAFFITAGLVLIANEIAEIGQI